MARTRAAVMGGEEGDQLVIVLPGGGSLGYAGFGDPDGVPCYAFHGMSSSRLISGWMFRLSGRTYPQLLWIGRVLCAVAGRWR